MFFVRYFLNANVALQNEKVWPFLFLVSLRQKQLLSEKLAVRIFKNPYFYEFAENVQNDFLWKLFTRQTKAFYLLVQKGCFIFNTILLLVNQFYLRKETSFIIVILFASTDIIDTVLN